ncbi:MAG: hypothetical protein WC841_03935 [Candidatus Shapirobacteria bacterium]|jgi:hypothetical protein
MKHTVVFSIHDTAGIIFDLVEQITPTLQEIFSRAVVSITPKTEETQERRVEKMGRDGFFELCKNEPGTMVGDHYMKAVRTALERSEEDEVIHVCTPDRLALAIVKHKNEFLKDMEEERKEERPILYERSDFAWSTHPINYRAIESMAANLGKILFGKELDFFWCDLAVRAGLLKTAAEKVKSSDFTVLAELILPLKDELIVKKVDWLEWEDPFIFAKEPEGFKKEREASEEENRKRLGYVVATIEWLLAAQKDSGV